MELNEALTQIAQIRDHIHRTEVFRGYRSLTVGLSGLLGIVAAGIQAWCIPRPTDEIGAYLALWLGTAAISAAIVAIELGRRSVLSSSSAARQLTVLAVSQFLPSLVAGGLVTLVIVRSAPEVVWMLPGLWAVIFSLGVFASCRLLTRAVFWAGAYYLACGSIALWCGPAVALAPWTMGVSFGGGQLLTAAILYFTMERTSHG